MGLISDNHRDEILALVRARTATAVRVQVQRMIAQLRALADTYGPIPRHVLIALADQWEADLVDYGHARDGDGDRAA